jgi:nicotinamidase/pyrazinamidase
LTKIHRETDMFVAIDVQNDFCPGGALPVVDGDAVVPRINGLSPKFANFVATQDWHTPGHHSFAGSHTDKSPYDSIELHYGMQTLWPDHCVQGTAGAAFHPALDLTAAQLILRKGFRPTIDSYSAFFENDKKTHTGLSGYLRDRGFKRVFFAGLATDFCVAYSAIDAVRQGFQSVVFIDACRAIDVNGSLDAALKQMKDVGVTLIESDEIG